MSDAERQLAAARIRQVFDLFDAGLSMKRAQLRREHPHASDQEVERRLSAWLRTRPGAEHGDAPGRPRAWDSTTA